MCNVKRFWLSQYCLLGRLFVAIWCITSAFGDELITDFEDVSIGSYNPRAGWFAFGNGTLDRGVISDGASGQGAFHSVNWDGSTWGIGNRWQATDLSSYTGLRLQARLVTQAGYSGVGLLRFSVNVLSNGAEWSTSTLEMSSEYKTYEFSFADLTLTGGSGALDLANAELKLTVRKNGQMGRARFDFDQVELIEGDVDEFSLTPVSLRLPPDGNAIRAMWLYPSTYLDTSADAQAILEFCAREGINRIYFSSYAIVVLGTDTQRKNLQVFLRAAHASGIRVESLGGDVNWQENPAIVQTRLAQMLAFHNLTPNDSTDDFDAVHFDVEFWLDTPWDTPDEATRQQIGRDYLDNVLVLARNYLDANGASELEIAVDLSAHFNSSHMLPSPMLYNGVTQHFVQHVLDHSDDVVFMSYYDSVSSLANTTYHELDWAAAKGRKVQLGANLQTNEAPINTFADNSPTAFSSMTKTLEDFQSRLTPQRLAALDGFTVFHYTGYSDFEPSPRWLTDLDGDGRRDAADWLRLEPYLLGPGVPADGLARDADFTGDGFATLADVALFMQCLSSADSVCLR